MGGKKWGGKNLYDLIDEEIKGKYEVKNMNDLTFFDKKSSGSGIANEPNYQLANELHKPIIRKSKKEEFIHLLETIFAVLIYLICNH